MQPLLVHTHLVPFLLTIAYAGIGVIYNPVGAWLHDKVNSRRWMFLVGLIGCLITTCLLTAMSAVYGGTHNKVGNGFGVFAIFAYIVFEG